MIGYERAAILHSKLRGVLCAGSHQGAEYCAKWGRKVSRGRCTDTTFHVSGCPSRRIAMLTNATMDDLFIQHFLEIRLGGRY